MANSKDQSVLKRKVGAGQPPADPFAMSVEKALRQSFTKAAQDLMDLPLQATEVEGRRMSLAELPETWDEHALLAVLDGPKEGLALIAVSPEILVGLIEIQTMGRIGTTPVLPRRATRTDAAILAGFIDAVLVNVEANLASEPDIVWAGGFRYASWMEDARPLALILEDTAYRQLTVKLDLGDGPTRSVATSC